VFVNQIFFYTWGFFEGFKKKHYSAGRVHISAYPTPYRALIDFKEVGCANLSETVF